MWWQIILSVVLASFTAFYFYIRHKMSYWRRMGVTEDPGTFPFGSKHMIDFLTQRIAFVQMTDHAYKSYPDASIVGTYDMFGSPSIVIRDLDIAKQILIKDFDKFMERKPYHNNAYNLDSKNNRYLPFMLTELRGDQWKRVRASLTPAFTSGKLKSMVSLIHGIAGHCNGFLEKKIGESFEAKELMRNFAMDVIVSTGFGYECDSLNDRSNIFKKNAELMVGKSFNLKMVIIIFLLLFFPRVLRWLDLPFLNREAEQFFAAAIMKAIKERQESGEKRNDFIDICTDILKKEVEEIDSQFTKNQPIKDSTASELSDDRKSQKQQISEKGARKEEIERILISNSLLMFLAGFDTVSSSTAIIFYFLAKNPDCQERLYQEIADAVKVAGTEELDYAGVMNLPYMEMFFQESLRMYPLTHLERASNTEYKIPGTKITLPKDMLVRFPATSIAKDPKYFPNPEVFNPENFTAANKNARHPLASGGFGHGPRNCIAQRFATMEVKIVVARILHKYRILPCDKTVNKLIPDPKSRSQQPKGEVWIKVELRS